MSSQAKRHVILGTAGHIDHGKSALVQALTGVDPDRLKEEKERGITIDLGFADLRFDDGLTIGLVDVPGHERLVRNMLAGAGGIDLVTLVIAADEGVMPQTREHLAICDLLGIRQGLVVLSKTDLVEPDWIELVRDDVKEFVAGTFLENADILPVSAREGTGMDRLKEAIRELALRVPVKSEKGLFRQPIDRVFTLKGFGTVVTGTTLSGRLAMDDPVEILPSGLRSRVRGMHRHGRPLKTALAGQRVAINLQGIEKDDLQRGDVVTPPGRLEPTRALDVHMRLLSDAPPVKTRSRVHLHVGTADTVARVVLYDAEILKPGNSAYGQLRLQDAVVAMAGDRFVLRRFSPLATIGGGRVLDPTPARRRKKDGVGDLSVLRDGSLDEILEIKIRNSGLAGTALERLEGWIQADLPEIKQALCRLIDSGRVLDLEEHLVHRDLLSGFRDRILATLKAFHRKQPMKPGMPKEELRSLFGGISVRLFGALLATVREAVTEQERVRSAGYRVSLSQDQEAGKKRVLDLVREGGFQPLFTKELAERLSIPERNVTDLLRMLASEGAVRRISETFFLTQERYEEILARLKTFFLEKPEMTVAEFRDTIQTTRKFALPLLEHLDASRVTLRKGDVRRLLLKE